MQKVDSSTVDIIVISEFWKIFWSGSGASRQKPDTTWMTRYFQFYMGQRERRSWADFAILLLCVDGVGEAKWLFWYENCLKDLPVLQDWPQNGGEVC